MTDIPALIQRARELASVFERLNDDDASRAAMLLRSLCTELEAERKRMLGPKDQRWK